ncbi:MAG: TIGR01212 family radical SAM protein [Bacteroidaceae bacterium]
MVQSPLYRDFSSWLAEIFPFKVQKISLHAGFTCPNRDGSLGQGGCTYCNNQTFNPAYCETEKSITLQLEEGKAFFSRKYPSMRYLAYFQAYTNTYGEFESLLRKYEEALAVEGIVGLVIGTRPDCVSPELLDYFARLQQRTFVLLEYGIESVYDATLQRINRGHSFASAQWAIRETAARGIPVGGHLILGLPGESREQILASASQLSALPLTLLKFHQLQLIKDTRMAHEYFVDAHDFSCYTVEEYIDLLVDYLALLRPDLVIDRFVSQSPPKLLALPGWGLKNFEFTERLKKRLCEREIHQGQFYFSAQ